MIDTADRPGERVFGAPWGRALWIVSTVVTAILAMVSITIVWTALGSGKYLPGLGALLPIALLILPALFTVRGYAVTADAIVVLRPIGPKALPPLATLQSARVEPNAMRRSLRLFGHGGLYAFSGIFRNRRLGYYRSWVTDLGRTVVLVFPGQTAVLSPESPEEFVAAVTGERIEPGAS
jgi:hypothetical protein